MMKYTFAGGKLEFYKDSLGRDAIFFSVFSLESARDLFTGSSWYTRLDDKGFSPLHYAILFGQQEVVSFILFEILPTLSKKELRAVLETYDGKKRNPMMLLVEKYPLFASRVMDIFGLRSEPFESGGSENLMVRVTYESWLISPYKDNPASARNKCLHLMVHFNRKDLTSHPLCRFVYEEKLWKRLVKHVFAIEFTLQLIIVIILAAASVLSNPGLNLGEVYTLAFEGLGWFILRLVIVILALIHLSWRLFVPIRSLIVLRTLDLNYRMISYCVIYFLLIL